LSKNLRASTSWNPKDLLRPVMGLLYLGRAPEPVWTGVPYNLPLYIWKKMEYRNKGGLKIFSCSKFP
jgi:hypothetical protein